MRLRLPFALASCLLVGIAWPATTARGQALVTEALDAADDGDPFDAQVELRYEMELSSGQLVRERPCFAPGAECPDRSGIVRNKELAWERVTHTLWITPRIGLYRDLELRLDLPIVLLMQDRYEFDAGVNAQNTSLTERSDANPNGTPLLQVPFNGPQRAGFGDMKVGLRWSPLNGGRDSTQPSWLLGFTWTAPTGAVRRSTNDGVGRGVHDIELLTAFSRRLAPWFEPFFSSHAVFRVPASDSLFGDPGPNQGLSSPGHILGVAVGAEFVPWEDAPAEESVRIEFGASADYVFEGREYSPLFETLADSPCNRDPQCTLTSATRELRDGIANGPRSNGITDVEDHGIFRTWLGLTYEPTRWVRLGLRFQYARTTDHTLTNADPGKDRNGDGVVTANAAGGSEYSPTYVENLDAPPGDPFTGERATRFRLQEAHTFGFLFAAAGRF
jgi:hypothetical protein